MSLIMDVYRAAGKKEQRGKRISVWYDLDSDWYEPTIKTAVRGCSQEFEGGYMTFCDHGSYTAAKEDMPYGYDDNYTATVIRCNGCDDILTNEDLRGGI
jgi:hypothetical protein